MFRQAEKEWKAFIEALTLTDHIAEADPQIPHLPSKDVIHRIYRDVSQLMTYSHRFLMVFTFKPRSGSVTTRYKTNLSASFSQSGRKGMVAHCTSTFLHSPLTRTNHIRRSYVSDKFIYMVSESRLTRSFRVSRSSKYLVIPHLAPSLTSLCLPIIHIKPGNGSLTAAGAWCPGKNELQTI